MTAEQLRSAGAAVICLGIFLFGLRTGTMPGGLAGFSRQENDWGFWLFGALYLGGACVAVYLFFFGATS